MVPVLIVGAVLALLAVAYVVSYNRFVSQRNLVAESWKQVDVELQRRFDLIPNLVSTVKGYAAHEASTLAAVTAARESAAAHASDSPAQRQAPEAALTAAVRGALAVAEAYPDLKASANFLDLQNDLAETEDRIAAARRFYNGNVRALNTRVQAVPSNIVASIHNIGLAEYFELADPAARGQVAVSFDPPTPGQ